MCFKLQKRQYYAEAERTEGNNNFLDHMTGNVKPERLKHITLILKGPTPFQRELCDTDCEFHETPAYGEVLCANEKGERICTGVYASEE